LAGRDLTKKMDTIIERDGLPSLKCFSEGGVVFIQHALATVVLELSEVKQLRDYLNKVIAVNDIEVSA
jgi:hypothetical protein